MTPGLTIVMTTNYLDEADQLCDRLAIIDNGKIRVTGSPQALKAGLGGDRLSVTLQGPTPEKLAQLSGGVRPLPFVRDIREVSNGLDIRVESPEKSLPTVLEVANRLDCAVDSIEYQRPSLEDVFVTHTGHAFQKEGPDAEEE